MKKEIIFFQGEEILNKFDEKRIFGKELTNAQNKYIFSILFKIFLFLLGISKIFPDTSIILSVVGCRSSMLKFLRFAFVI